MQRQKNLLDAFQAIRNERHEVAVVSLAVDLSERTVIVGEDWSRIIQNALHPFGSRFRDFAYSTSVRYGVPIGKRQLVLTPVPRILGQAEQPAFVEFARQLDRVAKDLQFDAVQGFSTVFAAGVTPGNAAFLRSLPQILAQTRSIQAVVEPARSRNGLSLDSLELIAEAIVETAQLSADRHGAAAARLAVGANLPSAGTHFLGNRWRDGGAPVVVDVGIDALPVIESTLHRMLQDAARVTLSEVFEEVKSAAFRMVRVGELIGRDIANACGAAFGTVDLSVGTDGQCLDGHDALLSLIGLNTPGALMKWTLLTNALANGGRFASPHYGGFCGVATPFPGAQFPDAAAVDGAGSTTAHADLLPVPGATSTRSIAELLGDRMTTGLQNQICQVARIVPVPEGQPGDKISLGDPWGPVTIRSIPAPHPDSSHFDLSGWMSGVPRSM